MLGEYPVVNEETKINISTYFEAFRYISKFVFTLFLLLVFERGIKGKNKIF